MTDFIPFSAPDIGEEEVDAVARALRSGWVTTGPEAKAFETEFGAAVGGDVEAIAVNSATAGLHLALEAMGVGPGDEVIVPTWTFTASAEVVRYLGAIPVLVDVDPATLNIALDRVAAAISTATRAVLVVHFAGLSVEMSRLRALIGDRRIKIIEDAAHAFPAVGGGSVIGSCEYSDAAVFSFYANKTITTGEGGMITTRDPELAARTRVMRLHGIDRDVFDRYKATKPSWAYDVIAPGFKYNMTDSAAAMGRVQLRRAFAMRDRRAEIAARYSEAFAGLPIDRPSFGGRDDIHAWHLYVARLSKSSPIGRDAFIAALADAGIGCSVHFIPLHKLTVWRTAAKFSLEELPAADAAFERAVSLPLFSRLTDAQVDRIIEQVTALTIR